MTEENPTRVEEVVRSGGVVASNPFDDVLDAAIEDRIQAFPEGKRIHAALYSVKVAMPAISKEGDLTFGSNVVKFTRVEDIRKALYPIFARVGVMAYLELVASDETLQIAQEPWTQAQAISPTTGEVDRQGIIQNSGRPILDGRIPKTRMWAWVEYRIRFVYIGDGSEVIVGPVKGSAYDTDSDKATGKATTAAIKRLIAETFDVIDEKESTDLEETGEDTKNRPETTDRRTVQDGQDRGAQARSAAAPGAAARPGRPSRAKKAPEPAVEEKPEAPQEPATPPQETPAAPEAPVEPAAPAEEPQAPEEPQQPSEAAVDAADPATGEVVDETPEPTVAPATPPAPPTAPMPDALAAAKERVKVANATLGLSKAEVDAIATEATGIADRADWIVKGTAVAKLADALEARVKAASGE